MRHRLVGLAGRKGSGKSTVSQELLRRRSFWDFLRGRSTRRVKFADPLKKAIGAIMADAGYTHAEVYEHVEGALKEVPLDLWGGQSTRHAMQTLGTEWGRNTFGDDFWVNIARRKVEDRLSRGGGVVVDDVRFPNEAAMVQDLGGVLVWVDRPGVSARDEHASESVDLRSTASVVLNNLGTVRALLNQVRGKLI